MSTVAGCYCGSGAAYIDCCQRLHSGAQQAQTAEQLMRSRYSAYCTDHYEYLAATHHPDTRASQRYHTPEKASERLDWVYLEILACSRGGSRDKRGEVEFLAWYRGADSQLQALHERSRFLRCDQQWFYLDGTTPPPLHRKQPNPGRNHACWCGSGHKFKRCHGKNAL